MSTATMKIPYNKKTGAEYRGRNIGELLNTSFQSLEWATFLQWRELGFKVKKGEHGKRCLTFGEIEGKNTTTGKIEKSSYMKGFVVFNREQVETI